MNHKKSSGRKVSIHKNAILNFLKSGSTVLFPLIIFPYTVRVLQVDNLGKVTYVQSIISYFSLFAALGVNIYGVREGAKKRGSNDFDRFASEVVSLNIITSAISYIILFMMLLFLPKLKEYRLLIMIQSATILLTILGIEWVNTVFEDFYYITIRTILIQILGMAALFIFIKQPEDYLKYAWISVLSSGLTCIANWFYCKRYTSIRFIFNKAIFSHFKDMVIFFANHLAITIYVSADTTMLGWISGDYYTGLYSVSVKIYVSVKTMLTAIYMVTIPRLSRLAEIKNWDSYRALLTEITSYIILLIFPCMAGLIAYADSIVLLISGRSFIEAAASLKILSVALIFAVGSGIVVNCINTPNGLEKTSLFATIAAAVTNIVLNIFLIPLFQQNGAALTTVIAELLVISICLFRLNDIRYYLDFKKLCLQFAYACGGSILIFLISICLKSVLSSPIISLVSGLILCPAAYILFLFITRNEYFLQFLSSLRNRLNKRSA